MIDLHLHTYYSDGTMSPKALVALAAEQGVDTIAITDHDGIGGIREGLEAGKQYGVRVLTGVELSAEDDKGVYMHILGYCFDPANQELNSELEMIRKKRAERNKKLLAALNQIGCSLTEEDLNLRKGQDYVGKPTFAMALVRKGYIEHPKEAFQEGRFMRSETVRSVHREKISAEKAIKLIAGAGGFPVLAHPMKVSHLKEKPEQSFLGKLDELLSKLKAWGLQGMECYYSQHTEGETEALLHLAEKHRLMVTAGSDFHGAEMDKDIAIGRFSTTPGFDKKRLIEQFDRRFLW